MENLTNLDIATSLIAQISASASSMFLSLMDSTSHVEPIPPIIRQMTELDTSDDSTADRFRDLSEQLYSQYLDAHNATTALPPDSINLSLQADQMYFDTARETFIDILLLYGPMAKTADLREFLGEAKEFLHSLSEEDSNTQLKNHVAKLRRLADRMRA